MTSPTSYKEFEKLVTSYGCTIERKGSHGKIKLGKQTISSFAVSHGKNIKGEEVRPIYIKNLLKALKAEGVIT